MNYHLRLESSPESLATVKIELEKVHGLVAVSHARGKRGEHLHWHVWYPLEKEINSEALLARLKKQPAFVHFKGNKMWSVRKHDDWEKWWQYVTQGHKDQEIIVNNSGKILVIPVHCTTVPIVSDVPAPIIPKISKKLPMREKFVEHLVSIGWKKNQHFSESSYDSLTPIVHTIAKELTEFWFNAFTIPEGERMVRHVMYLFGNDAVRDEIARDNQRLFAKKILNN